MKPSVAVTITGLGRYLPEKRLTNADLEQMVETSDEWISTRTGIKERRIAAKNECTSDLAFEAAKKALESAKLKPSDLDLIIVATITPDRFFPSTACRVQALLGASCGAFDLAAACSGFPYALSVGVGFIQSGQGRHVLVIGAEVLSGFIDWTDRSTCVLFGDGAGAAVISQADQSNHDRGVQANYLGSDGNQGDILNIPAGGSAIPPSLETVKEGLHFVRMQGTEVFKVAVRTMELAVHEVLKRAGLTLADMDLLIPHQANQRILNAVGERLKIGPEKIFMNVDRYGNMSSASTVIALSEAVDSGRVKPGSIVVLVAFGGGLTWAANVIKW